MKNILITGVSSNLGQSLLKKALEVNSYKIIGTSRSKCNLTDFTENPNFIHLENIDLNNEKDLIQIFEKVEVEFVDGFDIIHSVGNFWHHVPFQDFDVLKANEMMNSHYLTLYSTCYHLMPLMVKFGGGHLITFSCNSVKYNYPFMNAFTSAKAAVETFTKCIANEYSENNIVANSIALSSLQTEEVKNSKPFGDYDNFMTTDYVAKLVLSLNSSDFKYLNGNVINLFKYSKSFFNEGYLARNKN